MRHFYKSVTYLVLLWPFLSLFPPPAYSQDNFYLEKPPFKRTLIEPGDSVRVLIRGTENMIGLTFQGARDSTLFLSGDSLRLSQIEQIWIQRPRNVRYWLKMIVLSGYTAAILFPPLMVADALGRGGFQDYDTRRIGISVGLGLSMVAIGKRLRWKRFKLDGDKFQLAIRPPVERSVIPTNSPGQGQGQGR